MGDTSDILYVKMDVIVFTDNVMRPMSA